jgi:integrase
MADTHAEQGISEFLRWYSARRHRTTGAPARPLTLKAKRTHLQAALRDSGCQSMESLALLLSDRGAVELLLDRLAMRMSPGAMRPSVDVLKQFAEFARIKGWVTESCVLTKADMPPKNPQKPITIYTADETTAFVQYARGRGLRWWALVATLADTGRRIGELLSFRWEWFHLDESPAYVELPVTKNGTAQYVPLPRRLREEVFTVENVIRLKRAENSDSGRPFHRPPAEYPFPWGYPTVLARWNRFCEMTGLPNRTLHGWRHTVITRRIAAGVPIQAVASLAGHASPQITLSRYSHASSLDYIRYVDE